MNISAGLIKELREATGAGVLVCKQALEAHGGDLEQAKADLRQRGLQKAAAKAERETGDGLVVVKREGQVTAAVHVGCETDFVARTDAFRSFAHQLAERVLAHPGLDEVPALLEAPLERDSEKTVATTVRELVMRLGENITVDGVARYEEGPGRVVEGYIHAGTIEGYGPEEGRVGVLVEVQADEEAEEAQLRELAHDLALHIAASSPQYVALYDIPAAPSGRQAGGAAGGVARGQQAGGYPGKDRSRPAAEVAAGSGAAGTAVHPGAGADGGGVVDGSRPAVRHACARDAFCSFRA